MIELPEFIVPLGRTLTLHTEGKICDQDIKVYSGFRPSDGSHDSIIGTTPVAEEHEVFANRLFADEEGAVRTGTFTIRSELTEQDTLLEQVKKAVRYKAAGNLDLDPEMEAQDALLSDILTTLARKLPSKT